MNPQRKTAPANCYVTPRVTVKNYGQNTETFDVTCMIDSAEISIYQVTKEVSNLLPDSLEHLAFKPPWKVGLIGEEYRLTFFTTLPGDSNPSNDTIVSLLRSATVETLYYHGRIEANCYLYPPGVDSAFVATRMTPTGYPALVLSIGFWLWNPSGEPELPYGVRIFNDANPSDLYSFEPKEVIWGRPDTLPVGWWGMRSFDLADDSIIIYEHDAEFYSAFKLNLARCRPTWFHGTWNAPSFKNRHGWVGFPGPAWHPEMWQYVFRSIVRYLPEMPSISEESGEEASTIHFTLHCEPNPFQHRTLIRYYLPTNSIVQFVIYNLLGQEVKILTNGEEKAGLHSIVWDGRDSNGRRLPGGVYFLRLETEDHQETKKLLLLE